MAPGRAAPRPVGLAVPEAWGLAAEAARERAPGPVQGRAVVVVEVEEEEEEAEAEAEAEAAEADPLPLDENVCAQ